jgi:hypothetical protein
MTSAPALSVVVPSVNGWEDLARCLTALEPEQADLAVEVLVPERCGPDLRAKVAARFPWAVILPAEPRTTIPKLRAMAFAVARAPSVAVIEDHVLVPRGWARALLLARESSEVVGGGVRNAATGRTVDWAAFLCEYSHLLPPLAAGPSEWVTGNNTVYSRALLDAHRDVVEAGGWENLLHDAIRSAGVPLEMRPDIVVDHRKHYTVGEYLGQRYLYARSYAGMRVRTAGAVTRLGFGLAALALPPVLLARIVTRVFRKNVPRRLLVRCLPLLALFVTAWGVGEVIGYWFGPGGSLERVR